MSSTFCSHVGLIGCDRRIGFYSNYVSELTLYRTYLFGQVGGQQKLISLLHFREGLDSVLLCVLENEGDSDMDVEGVKEKELQNLKIKNPLLHILLRRLS